MMQQDVGLRRDLRLKETVIESKLARKNIIY